MIGSDWVGWILIVCNIFSGSNLLSFLSPLSKYVTSIASRDIAYKLKPKVVLICLSYSWIIC